MAQTSNRATQTVVWLAAATLLVACDSERSSNPLSPSIAGPLAGVTITAPTSGRPVDGQLLAVDAQPVTLTFQGAESNSPRPFWYEVQIAEDEAFEQILDTFVDIQAGENDVTLFELPNTLGPEHLYHWRVRAVDGANASIYSTGDPFEIYTPLMIGAPTLSAPPDGATTQIDAPVLSVNNATFDGPASDVVYRFEISQTQNFSSLTALLSVPPSASAMTSAKAGDLGYDLIYYWRVQIHAAGRTGNVVGPYSATWSFRTPPPPVVLGIPAPASPDGSVTTQTTRPTYIVNNGTVSGPAGTVTYQVNVATDAGFVMIVDSPSIVRSGAGQTSVPSQVDLTEDTVHYWRARATNGTLTTSWSAIAVFRTPSSGGGDGGDGGGGGGGGDGGGSGGSGGDAIDLSQVTFLHSDVSDWAVTSTVLDTNVETGFVCVYHTAAGQWPFSTSVFDDGAPIEGNIWIFAEFNGRWYGATWDWLRPGQECKSESADAFGRDQIRIPPMDSSWVPQVGDQIGLMMSTIARTNLRAGEERTNVVLVDWPY